nr:MAG TPA: hypothetical protein [Caudoviricetes sp.]
MRTLSIYSVARLRKICLIIFLAKNYHILITNL